MDERGREREREREREISKEATCVKKITLTPRGQRCHGNSTSIQRVVKRE